jgi:hypothetical protein
VLGFGLLSGLRLYSGRNRRKEALAFRASVRTPLLNSVPQGRLKIGRDAILNNLQPSLRDSIMFNHVPRTSVLG